MINVKAKNLTDYITSGDVKKLKKSYPCLKNQDVEKWIVDKLESYAANGKDPLDFNISGYLSPFQRYCDHYQVDNPSDLLTEDVDTRKARLEQYLTHLLNNGEMAESTIKNMTQSRIKSFYSSRGTPMPRGTGLKTVNGGTTDRTKNEIHLTRNLIQKIEHHLGAEYLLVLKCQALLGLRVSDVLETLTSGEYAVRKFKDHYYIPNFKTMKEQEVIKFLFFPKELTTAFQTVYNVDDLTQLDLSNCFLTTNDKRIARNHFLDRVKLIVNEKLEITDNIKNHSFRKYFATQLETVDLTKVDSKIGASTEEKFKEHLLGHKTDYSDHVYKKLTENIQKFYELWKHLESAICIDCEVVDKTSVEIKNLKKQYKELVKQVVEKDQHITVLEDRYEKDMKDMQDKFLKLAKQMKKMEDYLSRY